MLLCIQNHFHAEVRMFVDVCLLALRLLKTIITTHMKWKFDCNLKKFFYAT